MKKIFIAVAASFAILSCGENIEKKAQALVDAAQTACEQQDYQGAKLLLDSVKNSYPNAFKARRNAIRLSREVELGEQRRSILYYDNELAALEARRDSLLPLFVLEKNSKYQDVGHYMIPSQTVKNNLDNTYLRAQVDENGVATLTSVYRGKAISHSAVKVLAGDNYAECTVPFNKYSSKHLGVTTERVDFLYGQDGGLMDFIALCDSPVAVELSGDKQHKYTLRKADAAAIASVLELTKVIQAINSMREMRAEAERHIQFVERSKERAATPAKE